MPPRYAVASDGTLTYLGQVDAGLGSPGDEAVSQDGKYLYVLVQTPAFLPNFTHIVTYAIGKGGTLTQVASTGGLPFSASGLAAS